MTEIIKENFSAIIGIAGTILGVILGAVLESFSRRGKIKLFQKSLSYSFRERTDSAAFSAENRVITSLTDQLNISIDIEIFNTSSHSKKILRQVVFEAKSKSKSWDYKLFHKFESTTFESLSVNPKDISEQNLHVIADNDFEEILQSKWFIRYRDDKDKVQRFELAKPKNSH